MVSPKSLTIKKTKLKMRKKSIVKLKSNFWPQPSITPRKPLLLMAPLDPPIHLPGLASDMGSQDIRWKFVLTQGPHQALSQLQTVGMFSTGKDTLPLNNNLLPKPHNTELLEWGNQKSTDPIIKANTPIMGVSKLKASIIIHPPRSTTIFLSTFHPQPTVCTP